MRRYSAFTLAETLITLTVLGIIAAITVPNVINSYKQQITVTKVRKFYSSLYSVYSLILNSNNDNKDISIYAKNAAGTKKIMEDFILPHYKITYDAGTNTKNKQKIMAKENMKLLNGSTYTNVNYSTNSDYYAVKLKDGSTIWFRGFNTGDKTIAF